MQEIINNIKKNYLLSIIVIGLIVLSLYSTFAMFTASVNTNDIVNLSASNLPTGTEIIEYERLIIKAGEKKTIEFTVKNSTSGSLYYGAWYEMIKPTSITDDIQIAKQQDTQNDSLGELSTGSSAKVSLVVDNGSSSSIIVNIGVAYDTTSSMNLPTNRYLITKTYVPEDLIINTNDTNKFNNRGNYDISVNCSNATARWDYTNWKLVVSSLSGTICTPTFTDRSDNLSQFIIDNVGTEQGTGQIVNENGYRYEGKNPNNYVLFNDELWRIIGVFDANTHGQSGQNLTKIIRNESIGAYAWDKNGTKDWSVASLNTILNTYYYNSQNGTGQDACFFYSPSVPGNCDFRYTGLDATAREMIQEVTWYLGESNKSATAEEFYESERKIEVSSGKPTTATGYIGLMYPSDYGYSVLASSCARTIETANYTTPTCGGQSWILKHVYERTITPFDVYSNYVLCIDNGGGLFYHTVDLGFVVRPTAYLKSSVYIISGDGSEANPYVIGN